ncbi:crossover junction endonuclease EME1-like [Dendronephthya gigantea]|uniref:crossover junction endonuclease EME1-like n=1 Tax=Dendronephthya gigantea TaxID=151771 RepID=UPI00106B903C|nr:crossover junction endonuclease EME1-like [Dendronephthya gigantea]
MDGMVRQVLTLCPDADQDEVERDLNLTGDIEITLNRALDGMLSPKSLSFGSPKNSGAVTLVMDDDDDDILVLPQPNFTNIKERGLHKAENRISVELSDSDSELTETSATCKKTLDELKSRVESLEASSSKDHPVSTSTKSVPSSPDSDSELLKPVFDYDPSSRNTSCTSQKIPKPKSLSKCVVDLGEDASLNIEVASKFAGGIPVEGSTGVVKDTRGRSASTEVSSEEPVRKKKRTKEEVEERKREAMLKKAAKEKEKKEKLAEKERQKAARAAAQQEKKLQKEKDQLQRKAERMTKSANKLDGCMKFISVSMDPSLFFDQSPDPATNPILQKLSSMEANYVITSQAYPGSVLWRRNIVQHSVQDRELTITSSDAFKEENEVLIVLSAEAFAEMVFSFKQGYAGGGDLPSEQELPKTLLDFTMHVRSIYKGKKVTYIISGIEKYMRNVKLKGQRAFRKAAVGEPAVEDGTRKRRKKKVEPVLDVTRTDIEEALVDLQIKTNVCVYHCETDEDLAMKIAVFTKAVAEKPFKKSLTDELGICLDRLDKASLKVTKDGQGMVNVWQQQIQQFRNVSREMAAAIVAEYPSPQLLKEKYERCQSLQDALLLLEDIVVRRGGGSLATSRRIGPELSKRFYILFHSKQSSDLVKG